jgi:hypothetical protein
VGHTALVAILKPLSPLIPQVKAVWHHASLCDGDFRSSPVLTSLLDDNYLFNISTEMSSSHAQQDTSKKEILKKMWYLYTMEFYAAMKKNEMLSFAGKWMELENIILSEVSLAQKTKNRMFSLICGH